MTNARYTKTIALMKEEYEKVNALQAKGKTIIGIFRRGLQEEIKENPGILEGKVYAND